MPATEDQEIEMPGRIAKCIGLCVVVVLALWAPIALAQDDDSPEAASQPGQEAARYLPSPEDLGDGWSLLSTRGVDALSSDLFQETAIATYGGPRGARAVVIALIVTDEQIAIRRAWDSAGAVFNRYLWQNIDPFDNDDDKLDGVPAPAGCEEVERGQGPDNGYGFITAVTVCAGPTNEIVMGMMSGGDAITQGYEASDALVQRSLQAGQQ
jgi:hypothetical protein